MESPKIVYRYYSNPAFCAQSEVVFSSTSPCVSSKITPDRRMSPLGANSPRKNPEKHSHRIKRTDISDNVFRNAPSGIMRDDSPPELPPKPAKFQTNFYRQSSMIVKPTARATRSRTRSEDLEMAQIRQRKYQRGAESDDGLEGANYSKHRYEVIEGDLEDLVDFSPTKKRIIEADAEDINEYNVDGPDENEMKEMPTEIVKTVNGKTQRYAIIPLDDEEPQRKPTVTFSPPKMSRKNLIATQKLHELLSTPPRHLKSYGSQPSIHVTPNKASPNRYVTKKIASSTPTKALSSSKSLANLSRDISKTSPISPKAQQKLHYGIQESERQDVFVRSFREVSLERDKRERESERRFRKDKSMAVIVPRIAHSPPSDSDETYKSWLSMKQVSAATASLAVAALMMTLCGGLSAGLSFYMMYSVGRRYYLDFGVLSGFTCLLLGILGFRSRKYTLLPNRNYISGYIVLSTFSILSAIGLLILLTLQPLPGTPPHDVTSGAVCGLSILSLMLTSVGVVTSYCCRHPPEDNRVASVKWY